MDYGGLQAHLWNLSFGVTAALAVVGCGPSTAPEGETEAGTATETSAAETETDTTPGACVQTNDCQPGEECIDGACVPYDDYYCDDACCDGECYDDCSSDAECGPMGVCPQDGLGCAYPPELPECEAVPSFVPLPLPPVPGIVASLAFVDANGDAAQDLVVGWGEGTELHLGGSEPQPPVPLPLDGFAQAAAAGDFDDDGDMDLVFSTTPASLVLLAGNGDGTFAEAQSLALAVSPEVLVPLQWDGQGPLELATLDTNGDAVLRRAEGGVLAQSEPLATTGELLSLVARDYAGDGLGDLVAQGSATADVYVGGVGSDVEPDFALPGPVHGPRQLWAARTASQPTEGLLGLTPLDGWVLVELWDSGTTNPQLYALVDDGYGARVGDVDGDGVDDVVTLGSMGLMNGLSLLRGGSDGEPGLACRSPIYAPQSPSSFEYEVGDFDGNGRADVAIADDEGVTIMLTQ